MTHVLKQLESEKTWDEKTDLFEGDFDFVEEENEDGTVSYVIRKVVDGFQRCSFVMSLNLLLVGGVTVQKENLQYQ